MARSGRLVLLATALTLAVLPRDTAFAGTRGTPAVRMGQISQSRVGMRSDSSAPRPREVYVANLDNKVSLDELKAHFRQAGEVVDANIKRGSKGPVAFVELKTSEQAEEAIEKLQSTQLGRRPIFVDRVKKPRVGMQATPVGACEVFLSNLDRKVSLDELKDHMRQAGEVVGARIRGGSKGPVAFVEFKTPEEAENAIEKFHATELGRYKIFLDKVKNGVDKDQISQQSRVGMRPPPDACEVYVSGFGFRRRKDGIKEFPDLKDHMRLAGEVVDFRVRSGAKGNLFAIVKYGTPDEAENAIEKLHKTEFGERILKLHKAKGGR